MVGLTTILYMEGVVLTCSMGEIEPRAYKLMGRDTANYSEGDMGNPTDHAITVRFDLNSGNELDGNKPIVVSDDGYGASDYLFSIEKIVGTAFEDTVEVNGGDSVLNASSYALSSGVLEIDFSGGDDTLDFTNFSGSVDFKKTLATGSPKVGDVTFLNFEIVKDSDSKGRIGEGSGILKSAYAAISDDVKEIYGNGGDDLLVIGPPVVKK